MKNKAMAYKPKDYLRKVKPVEKPADIGTKPVPSWVKTQKKQLKKSDKEYNENK